MAVVLVPVAADKANMWKAFAEEISGPKKAAFADLNSRYGLTRHEAWWCETPAGYFVVAIHEGPGADTFFPKISQSKNEFDVWFLKKIGEAHNVDFTKPPPGPMPVRKI